MLVYPFQHAASGNDKKLRMQRLSKWWQHWCGRFDDKGLARALDDTYFPALYPVDDLSRNCIISIFCFLGKTAIAQTLRTMIYKPHLALNLLRP